LVKRDKVLTKLNLMKGKKRGRKCNSRLGRIINYLKTSTCSRKKLEVRTRLTKTWSSKKFKIIFICHQLNKIYFQQLETKFVGCTKIDATKYYISCITRLTILGPLEVPKIGPYKVQFRTCVFPDLSSRNWQYDLYDSFLIWTNCLKMNCPSH
jgi:hypothetical protein